MLYKIIKKQKNMVWLMYTVHLPKRRKRMCILTCRIRLAILSLLSKSVLLQVASLWFHTISLSHTPISYSSIASHRPMSPQIISDCIIRGKTWTEQQKHWYSQLSYFHFLSLWHHAKRISNSTYRTPNGKETKDNISILKKFITLMLKNTYPTFWMRILLIIPHTNHSCGCLKWQAVCSYVMCSIDISDMSKSKKQEYHWEEATCVKKIPFLIKSGQCLFAYRE